ncbi:medium-chain fatty acid-CoA ligase faa2, partial [Coemansia sp. RSA 2675]
NGLKGFEIPKNIFLESKPFTIENELLTPTFKVKRPVAKEAYKAELERLYAEPGAN